MSDNTKLYDMAALAEASYVFFDKLDDYSDKSVSDALKDSDLKGTFSATQATDFVSHWQVVSHLPNTSSGFSATLFKNKQTGEGNTWGDILFDYSPRSHNRYSATLAAWNSRHDGSKSDHRHQSHNKMFHL
jgi:hypothetical protein